ncbi:uncharacterized protein LOC116206103 isoform X1 [Punica granatum]|uniref:Uncharacterized protein LOC116206103 isoform X1 n=1 Tax=Punica granatum TaxID=22663 RepID=A0A6P8DBY8_PUNGR|nr:uncharacterized protein LOC116206103 isoform X1 [Punica granatum]
MDLRAACQSKDYIVMIRSLRIDLHFGHKLGERHGNFRFLVLSPCASEELVKNGGNRNEEEKNGRKKRKKKSFRSCLSSSPNEVASRQAQAEPSNQSPQGDRSLHHIQVPNYFTSAESQTFVKVAESIGFTHQGSLGPLKGEAYRDNDRVSVNDPALANTIWESGLNTLFSNIKIRGKVAVGLNPNIRFYRYKVGQRFGRHIDESVDLGEGRRTHYTLLIYLSGGPKLKNSSKDMASDVLVGGETVFYNSWNNVVAEVAPTEGMALVHIHGDKCMLHEARNVTKGVKYVFRSDVVFA